MCGIVGIFSKSSAIAGQLGSHMSRMLVEMSARGPDSAGAAIYGSPLGAGACRVSMRTEQPGTDWRMLESELAREFGSANTHRSGQAYACLQVAGEPDAVQHWIETHMPELDVMSVGRALEIYKDAVSPRIFVERFELARMSGTHALGHTRMATESRVNPNGSHPFSTGLDLCLVHNGSLSNHNQLRRELQREGISFRTENDSEVAAGYLTWRLRGGSSIEQALEGCLEDLDGFYTFAVGTLDGFAVLRDPIACKPAVIAETDDWVAMASEFRALALLPGAADAQVWEPEGGRVYTWGTTVFT